MLHKDGKSEGRRFRSMALLGLRIPSKSLGFLRGGMKIKKQSTEGYTGRVVVIDLPLLATQYSHFQLYALRI